MNEYVTAIATAAVASATARFPLYTIWNVSKYENFFGTYFPIFGLNTEIYGVNIRIKPEYGNIRHRKNSTSGYFRRPDNTQCYLLFSNSWFIMLCLDNDKFKT